MRVVVGPARALAQPPVALAQAGVGHRAQQPLVERAQVAVRRLVGPAAEEHRDRVRRPVELAVVVEARALQRRHDDRRRPRLRGPKVAAARGSSWFSTKRTRRSW